MQHDISSILDTLQNLNPMDPNSCRSSWEVRTRKLSKFLRWTGCILLVFLFLIVGTFRFVLESKPGEEWWLAVLVIVVATEVLASAWLLVDIFSGLPILIKHQEFAYLSRKLEIEHDISNALKLLPTSNERLQFVEKWLSIKMERTKAHISLFFGSPDKVAIFALAGMGWLSWKEFQSANQGLAQDAMLFVFAFFGGCAIGSLLQQRVLKRMAYQKDLISLAIAMNNSALDAPTKISTTPILSLP